MKDNYKICVSCNISKKVNCFGKHKRKFDGLRASCKNCENKSTQLYRRTKNGLIATLYSHQRDNSRKRSHIKPSYNLTELRKWVKQQNNFELLYNNWVYFKYNKNITPSIDRLDDDKPYSISNIKLTTWYDNKKKSHNMMRSGILKHGHNIQKKVLQYTKNGILIDEFVSTMDAKRRTGIWQASISLCCRGEAKTAGGFIWKFKIEDNG